MTFNELDAKMRVYEQSLDQIIPPENYLLARIDGRSFTRLTKEICQFETPFDERFNRMMVETVKALVADTGMEITYGYTQSDEISLLFAKDAQVFGRKVRKLNSVLAGTASARFSLLIGLPAVFDCRIIPLPNQELVADYFRWRMDSLKRICTRGLEVSFVVERNDAQVLAIPVLILVILILFLFPATIPLLVVGLFFGFRYHFEGLKDGSVNVNDVMDKVADGAESFRNDVMGN